METYTILVTGGNGFLGQHVVKHLQEKADWVTDIRVLDLQPFEKQLRNKFKTFYLYLFILSFFHRATLSLVNRNCTNASSY